MKSDPLISIVLPTYNGVRYLSESIESCLLQTYRNWELIIIDDASTDDTPSIIERYVERDSRIRSFRNPVNRKLPGSLNDGFARTSGEFLTWTSDDNCYRPEALAEMLRVLCSNQSVDLVYADFTLMDEDGIAAGPGWAGPLEELAFGNCIGACFLYRRAVHEQLGGYSEHLALVEDYDFWLRASALFRLRRLEKDLYLYRQHANSLTVTEPERVRAAHEQCLLNNLPRLTWMNAGLRARAYRRLVYEAVERGDRRAAWSLLLSWARRSPDMIRSELQTWAYLVVPAWLHNLVRWNEPWDWLHRLRLAMRDIAALVPPGDKFVLADEGEWGRGWNDSKVKTTRLVLPFIEKNGQYWGLPEDDETAIREFERLRGGGSNFIVFAWPAFWWLDYYSEFHNYLRSRFPCVLENERLVIFDLRV